MGSSIEKLSTIHIPSLLVDGNGVILSYSDLTAYHLIGIQSGQSIYSYFPDIKLAEGEQNSRATQSYFIKDAIVSCYQSGDKIQIYFSQNPKSIPQIYEHQLHVAEIAVVGEMTAGIAHEISNPLTIITGFAKNILMTLDRDKIASEKIESKANRIVKTVKRASEIISSIRKLARGLEESEPMVSVEVQEILREALILSTFKLSTHNVSLDIAEYDKKLSLECHPIELVQVVINIINNAVDALEGEKQPEVHIEVEDHGKHTMMKIKDSGGSLPENMYEKIFEQNVTTKKVGKGTGLGLYLSKKIILSHNGTLKAYVENGWTVFEILMPKKSITPGGEVE